MQRDRMRERQEREKRQWLLEHASEADQQQQQQNQATTSTAQTATTGPSSSATTAGASSAAANHGKSKRNNISATAHQGMNHIGSVSNEPDGIPGFNLVSTFYLPYPCPKLRQTKSCICQKDF